MSDPQDASDAAKKPAGDTESASPAPPAAQSAEPKTSGNASATKIAYGVMFGLVVGVLIGLGSFSLRPSSTTESATPPPATAAASEKMVVAWRMASAFQGEVMQLGTGGRRFAELISKLSGGEFVVRFVEPGASVPVLGIFDAVRNGDIDAGWTLSTYWSKQIPAASFFSGVPFGPPPGEFLAWLKFGGGQAIYDDIYAAYGVRGLPCAVLSADASGWFSKEIKSVADFRGLKVRYYGLGARILEKLGAVPTLPAGDVYEALESGALDAAEYATPAIDAQHFFDRVAGHYYFPGWHQQATLVELLVSRSKWDALSDRQRLQIEASCGDNLQYTLAESEAAQARVLGELRAAGVQFHTWSPRLLAQFRKRWLEVVGEESAKDPNFKRAATSLTNFRQNYAVWRDLGYL